MVKCVVVFCLKVADLPYLPYPSFVLFFLASCLLKLRFYCQIIALTVFEALPVSILILEACVSCSGAKQSTSQIYIQLGYFFYFFLNSLFTLRGDWISPVFIPPQP